MDAYLGLGLAHAEVSPKGLLEWMVLQIIQDKEKLIAYKWQDARALFTVFPLTGLALKGEITHLILPSILEIIQ